MKITMMIISLAVHHVVLVCAAAFELRVRLVVTDLARSDAPPLSSPNAQSLHQSLLPVQRPSRWIYVSVGCSPVLVSVGCCDRGADLQLACLLVDDLIKSVWRPLSTFSTPIVPPLFGPVSGICCIDFGFVFSPISIDLWAQWKSSLVNWL